MSDEKQQAQADPENGLSTNADGSWLSDVDAFAPKPEGHVKIKGVSYPIFNFLDIPIEDSLRVARLGVDIQEAETYEKRMERSVEQIMLLNAPGEPKLTREVFKSVKARQIITLTVLASSVAKIPQEAGRETGSGAESSSPSASPASAASSEAR